MSDNFEIKTFELSRNGFDPDVRILFDKLEALGAFSPGFFIAGGFPRRLAHTIGFMPTLEKTCETYFEKEICLRPAIGDQGGAWFKGDVDVFMSRGAECQLRHSDFFPSKAGYALNKNVYSRKFTSNVDLINVQFVTDPHFQYSSIRECFTNFDFVNCRYALTMKDKDTLVLHWDPQALELDRDHKLRINQINSPQLGARVIKYVKARGCENGLDEESQMMLHEWCLRVACEKWDPVHDNKLGKAIDTSQRSLYKLAAHNMVTSTDLVLFLQRWTASHKIENPSGYGHLSVSVDWAGHMLALKNEQNMQKNVFIQRL